MPCWPVRLAVSLLGRLADWLLGPPKQLQNLRWPDEEADMLIAIQCFGGEKDGWTENLEVKAAHPKQLYMWPTEKDELIRKAKGDAAQVLRSQLGTLCYRYDHQEPKPEKPGGVEYQYAYYPKRNKRTVESSATAPKG